MNRLTTTLPVLTIAGAFAGLVSIQETVSAQEVQVTGPLAGAPAVRHMKLYREGRVQLQPFFGFTLQDEYKRNILLGGQINYHLTDWLGIGVWGGFVPIHTDTDLTDKISTYGETTAGSDAAQPGSVESFGNRFSFPNKSNFSKQIATMKWVAALQATFIPLRGKLGLFESIFVNTDLYVFGGAAMVGIEERANATASACINIDGCRASQTARASRSAFAPTFGAGLSMYTSDWLALTLEWRALPFSWNPSGTDEGGPAGRFPDGVLNSDDRQLKFNHMLNIGVAFYLPTKIKITD